MRPPSEETVRFLSPPSHLTDSACVALEDRARIVAGASVDNYEAIPVIDLREHAAYHILNILALVQRRRNDQKR